MTKNKKDFIKQFIGFCFVGVTNFIVSYVTYALCLKIFGLNAYISAMISFIVSVFNAYVWNNKFVFNKGQTNTWLKKLLRTYISYGITGLLLTEILLYVEIDIFKLPALVAPFINLVITTPINFVLNKYWAFGEKNEK